VKLKFEGCLVGGFRPQLSAWGIFSLYLYALFSPLLLVALHEIKLLILQILSRVNV